MKIANILVPVKGIPADEEAIRFAAGVARAQKSRLYSIYVIELKRSLPLDAESAPEIQQGEQILERADEVARAAGVHLETELLQARVVGPVLLDEAVQRKVDLIVMGVPYRPPLDDFYLGATVRYILKNAVCRVWLCREPVPAPENVKK